MKTFEKVLVVALLIVIVLLVGCIPDPTPTPAPTVAPTEVVPTATPFEPVPDKPACLDGLSFGGPAFVVSISDTDTIYIETPSGIEKIDFVGVNAWNDDEREDAGEEFVKELLPIGAFIELALDPVVQEHNGKPAYYIYFGETFVNATIIETGNARPRSGVVDDLVCGEYFRELAE